MRPDSVYRSIAHGNHCMRMDHACTWPTSAYKEGEKMKFRVIVSAVVLTLLSTAAFAQDANRPPESRPEQTPKADLVAGLKDAVAYCDKAYDSMTDASGSQTVKLFDMDMPKFGVLNINNMHDMEHYGNLVTYMRLKNIVPPTSEQPPAAPQKK